MPLAGRLNLIVDSQATLRRTFALTNEDGNSINLTGREARIRIRSEWEPTGTLYATFGTDSPDTGITIPTPANGEIVWGPIEQADLASVPDGQLCVWDLFIYGGGGDTERLVYGTFLKRPYATDI